MALGFRHIGFLEVALWTPEISSKTQFGFAVRTRRGAEWKPHAVPG